jgi:hypothetical protein
MLIALLVGPYRTSAWRLGLDLIPSRRRAPGAELVV